MLLDRYGTTAEAYLSSLDGAERMLAHAPTFSTQEIAYSARHERVGRLSDIVLRRTLIGLLGQASAAAIAEIAGVAGEALDWPAERVASEIEGTTRLLAARHGVPVPA